MHQTPRKLIFENGRVFPGTAFGTTAHAIAEVVFNTSMVGYQEIASDPSYCAQMVVMTYPLIGNYGLADEDFESRRPFLSGLIVRDYNDMPSGFRYTQTLDEWMRENGVPGITGVDTRAVTRMIRDEGSMRALLTGADVSAQEGLSRLRAAAVPNDQVLRVTSHKRWQARTSGYRYHVVAIDYGIKYGIIRSLNARGCNVTILPAGATAADVRALRPDGLFLSNGPGDPEDVPQAVALVRQLQGTLPIFGICLGHQLIALANGARTYKMKFGHRGGNHPVKNLKTGKIEITSQNHSYAVDGASLSGTGLHLTHVNLLDGTAEGAASESQRIFSVQYHPESAPGPQDSGALFDLFLRHMDEARQEVQHAQA